MVHSPSRGYTALLGGCKSACLNRDRAHVASHPTRQVGAPAQRDRSRFFPTGYETERHSKIGS
jgi:hypothetical protein